MCGCCFKLIGCCCCFLFIVSLILCLVASYFYAVYLPEFPSYDVEKFEVKSFDIRPDSTLAAEILIAVRAANPNANIGFIYGQSGVVSLVFNETDVLCWGRLPQFRQGHKNVTMIAVQMVGRGPIGPGLQAAYDENVKSRKPVPLAVRAEMPLRIVLEEAPLREIVLHVNSSIIVDNLVPNKTTSIVWSGTTFYFDL